MALIPQDDLTTLQAASAVKTVAASAVYEQDIRAIAYAINSAANTGETRVVITMRLSDQVKSELKNNGYTLTTVDTNANPANQTIVSWESAS